MNSGISLVACFALPLLVAIIIGTALVIAAVRRGSGARGGGPYGSGFRGAPGAVPPHQNMHDPTSPLYTGALLGAMNAGHAPPTARPGDHGHSHHPPSADHAHGASNSIFDAAGGNTDFSNNSGGLADFGSSHDAGGGFDSGGGGGFDGGGGGSDGGGGGGGGD